MFESQQRPILNAILPYIPGKAVEEVAAEYGVSDIIKLASNENPLGCPVTADQLAQVIAKAAYYPHEASAPIGRMLAARYNITPAELIFGNGSDELIQLLGLAFVNPGETVLTSEHTFSEYAFAAKLADGKIETVPMTGFRYDLAAMAKKVTQTTKLVFIANPNNPTGTFVTHTELTAFLKQIPATVIVALDEAYIEYADAPDMPDSLALMKRYPNLISLRTFSKIYGLAGFRIGYAIGHPDVILALRKVKPPFNVNSIALKAAEIAFQDKRHLAASKTLNATEKKYLDEQLTRLNLEILPSQANFICMTLPLPAKQVHQDLLRRGVIIRPLDSFGLPRCIRVTIGTRAQNDRFLKELTDILKEAAHVRTNRKSD